jgi:hypothetical protein
MMQLGHGPGIALGQQIAVTMPLNAAQHNASHRIKQ